MSLYKLALRGGGIAVLAVLLGVLGALTWRASVPTLVWVIQPDGRAVLAKQDLAGLFAMDAHFSLIGVVIGLAVGVLTWMWIRRAGWVSAVVAAGGGLLDAFTCLTVAGLLGPGELPPRLAAANPGDEVPVAFALDSPSAVAIWPFGALVVPLIGSAFSRDEES